ncbi:YVTN family beta-propeller protein [Mycobacterium sp. OAS707]|uniref:Ig-like domain-containing protein n=1 Tax=Mycobacterium sp. OAS707 TaxID=2663822 RepID=UPI00178ACFF9|nr:Ig-like domain-containing protein [Mycobacterium sp. OAS707]MBE1548850.1 YVTN family beta-propeller protein [Mycobacterium sp. OAS707]
MTSWSRADAAPMLMVCQVGPCDRVTGAVTYQATVGNDAAFALSFTEPRDGEVADLGYGMFRYTPHPRVNAESDSFTVIADDGRGGSFDSLVTWVNDNQVPVAVAPPRLWPPDPTTGAVTVSPNIVDPDGDWLTYTLDAPFPRRGSVTIDWDGTFTYVPYPSERDDTAAGEETLGFRAVDPRGASAYITVTVPICPRRFVIPQDPDSAMQSPDPRTGVITGSCGGTAEGYTYAASAPAKGTVMIDAKTGVWAYRPAATARHRAVADDASTAERHDKFTITLKKGKRDKVTVPVSVPLVSMRTVPSYAVTAEIPLGVVPAGMAVSPRGEQVYVTSFVGEAAVTVVRTVDNTLSRIPLTFRPEGIVVGPDGRRLYVADPAGRRVAVIDPTEHTTTFIPVGDRPFHMAVLGADLYVANNQDGTVSVIDTIEGVVVRTIEVGGHPYTVAGALGQAFVTDYSFYGGESTHSVSVIAARGDLIGIAPAGYYPTGVAVSPDDRRIYVANNEGSYNTSHPGTTTVINATTGAVMDTLPVGGCAVAVSDNGDHVYVASQGYDTTFTSKLSIVDLPTGRITNVPIHGMPNALALSGDRVYVTDTWHSSLVQVTARDVAVVDSGAANHPPQVTITEAGYHLIQVTAVDPDNDTVTFTASQPFCGTVNDLGNGLFQYTPSAMAVGGFIDRFAITVDDGHGGVVTKTVALGV